MLQSAPPIPRAELYVWKMSLHFHAGSDRSSTYSALMMPQVIQVHTASCLVPILPYKRASKWNSTINKQSQPFIVAFETEGMSDGGGVSCEALVSQSATAVTRMVVRGGEPVHFPDQRKKIQLRIVVGHIERFRAANGRFV